MLQAIPLELPFRAAEAVALGDLIVGSVRPGPLRDEVRQRIGARANAGGFETLRPFAGSLARDPIHGAAFFIAMDALSAGPPVPLLLRIASSEAPASALYPRATLIARTRSAHGPELVINAIPFGASDGDAIRTYAKDVDSAFLPRARGLQPLAAIVTADPATDLFAAFNAYRRMLRESGQNVAGVVCEAGDPETFLDAALWSAIRAGWRDGFSAGIRVSLANGLDAAREIVRRAAGYTRFSVAAAGDQLEQCAALHGHIGRLGSRQFDFELSLEPCDPTIVVEWIEALRRRGCAVQSVAASAINRGLAEALRPLNVAVTVNASSAGPAFGARLLLEIRSSDGNDPALITEAILSAPARLRG